jgi:phosphate transport system substrate-binding protein
MSNMALRTTLLVAISGVMAACGGGASIGDSSASLIRLDGSSTVYPISEAVAEEFQIAHQGMRVTVGVSGTGGGFQKFCAGETDITNASRPIKSVEVETCAAAGIAFTELPVAYDGLAVVVHPANTWVDHVTVAELRTIWAPEAQGTVLKWSDVRPGWPDRELHLFGAGVDSGTYDYFTEAIVGQEGASRGDFTASEDDNVLVQGVSTDETALGFFGFEYFDQNRSRLKLVPVDDGRDDNGSGPIAPSPETVRNGTYQPLSRPLFIYLSHPSLERPEVRAFIDFYLSEGASLIEEVGSIPFNAEEYALVRARYEQRVPGSLFTGGSQVGVTIDDLLSRE